MTELDEESIKMYGKPLQGKYKHFCNEFDFLPIDETCFEFQYCTCFESTPEIESHKKMHRIMDRLNNLYHDLPLEQAVYVMDAIHDIEGIIYEKSQN
jgi:hypothetical protein